MSACFLLSVFRKVLTLILVGLLFVLLIDPYGINPYGINIHRVNAIKYQRVKIDRLIKPWEVYWKQPKTIFMGTSRPHQAFNPEVMKDTMYAPIYNAGVPASTLNENFLYLKKYFELNKNIRYVILDIFWLNFLWKQNDSSEITYNLGTLDFFTQFLSLFFSLESFTDSLFTFGKNIIKYTDGHYISSHGYYVYPPNIDSKGHLNEYLKNMCVEIPKKVPIEIDPEKFKTIDKIAKLCAENGAKLILTVLPEHPISDYYCEDNEITPLRSYVLRRLSTYPNVYYFSALNEIGQNSNPYWWDPHHPSITVGNMALECIKDEKPNSKIPDFGVLLTPKNVEQIIKNRHKGLLKWIDLTHRIQRTTKKLKINISRILSFCQRMQHVNLIMFRLLVWKNCEKKFSSEK